jgi:hypothetical protein
VSTSSLLLPTLEEAQLTDFDRLMPGDESWFHLLYPHQSALAVSRDQLPEDVSEKSDTEKCLVSVLWPIHGIHSLVDVPKGTTYNIAFLCDIVVPSVVADITSRGRRKTHKGFMTHRDSAPAHNSRLCQACIEATRAVRLPHPAYSPALAQSDFFLFGSIKEKLTEHVCTTREEPLSAIITIFSEIEKETVMAVFTSWTKGLRWVIKHKGEYYHKLTIDEKLLLKMGREMGRSRTYRPPYHR